MDSDFGMCDDGNAWTLFAGEAQVNEISSFSMPMTKMMTTTHAEQVKILEPKDKGTLIDDNEKLTFVETAQRSESAEMEESIRERIMQRRPV